MKITIITGPFGALPPYAIGAIERRWYLVGERLREMGHVVCFVSKRPNNRCGNNNIYIKGYERTGSWFKDMLLDFLYSLRALKMAPKSDAVILNSIWSPILYLFFKKKFKVSIYNVARYPKRQLFLYNSMDCLSCVSSAVYDAAISQTPSIKRKCCVINNPINTFVFNARGGRIIGRKICVVYSGRVHREKGLDILVSAVAFLRNKYEISLKIVGAWNIEKGGSGKEYVDSLDSLAKGWRIDWVDPLCSSIELANELQSGDIFCYPSVADSGETFGVAPLEAMGVGLVPVVSELNCFKDFITDGLNGLTFDHRANDRSLILASKIEYLINNPEVYNKLSFRASQTASNFSVDNIAHKYEKLFNELMNGNTISQKP